MDFRKLDNVSVNCVIFGLSRTGLFVLLQKRELDMFNENYPKINDWMLTEERTFISKTLEESADVLFKQTTHLEEFNKIQFKTYGNSSRIKSSKDRLWARSHGLKIQSMTIAYYFVQPKQNIKVVSDKFKWFPLEKLPTLGFNHEAVIRDAHEDLKRKIMVEPLIFALLPYKFTLNELQAAFESVLNIELDNRNFRKKVTKKIYIVPLNETKKGSAKKPSKLYAFSKDVYEKVTEKEAIVNI